MAGRRLSRDRARQHTTFVFASICGLMFFGHVNGAIICEFLCPETVVSACAPLGTCEFQDVVGGGKSMASASVGDPDTGVSAAASAEAEIGTLRVSSSAVAPIGISNASAGAAWTENVFLHSTTLPPGTEVDVAATLDLHFSKSFMGDASGYLQFSLSTTSGFVILKFDTLNPSSDINSFTIKGLQVGSGISLVGTELSFAQASFDAEDPDLESSGDEDASDTATIYLDSLTPGVVLVGSSGYDFSTPSNTVPEPGNLATVGSVLLLLGLVSFRRLVHARRRARDCRPTNTFSSSVCKVDKWRGKISPTNRGAARDHSIWFWTLAADTVYHYIITAVSVARCLRTQMWSTTQPGHEPLESPVAGHGSPV
jgi:hypothetical protein